MANVVLNGYSYDKQNEHASTSAVWYKAVDEKGKSYFLKKFNEVKYPSQNMMYDPKCRVYCNQKIKECEEWLGIKLRVVKTLGQVGNGSGNLVFAKEFFRENTSFFSVTAWIDIKNPSVSEIAALSADEKLFLLQTYCSALKKVHDVGIIHGDLKPENVLVTESETKRKIAKIIDFDDSYFSGEALSPDKTKYTPEYASPELQAYKVGTKNIRERLTCLSDVFASGIIFHEFWCGRKPGYEGDNGSKCFCKAVISKEPYKLDESLPDWLHDLIADMLQREPENRPTVSEAYDAVKARKYTRKTLEKGYVKDPDRPGYEVFRVASEKPRVDVEALKKEVAALPKDLDSYGPDTAVRTIKLINSYWQKNLEKFSQNDVDEVVKKLAENRGQLFRKQPSVPASAPAFDKASEGGKLFPADPLPQGCKRVTVMGPNLVKIESVDGKSFFKTKAQALENGYVVWK